MKHTPGPWEVDTAHEEGCGIAVIPGPTGGSVAEVYGDNKKQQKANAQLIAEAGTVATETGLSPRQLVEQRDDLLKALEGFVTKQKRLTLLIQHLKRQPSEQKGN